MTASGSDSGLTRVGKLLTAFGAQRKHVILPTEFRSPSENGHSRYGQLTARFALFGPRRHRAERLGRVDCRPLRAFKQLLGGGPEWAAYYGYRWGY